MTNLELLINKLRDVAEIWPKTGMLDIPKPDSCNYGLIPVREVAKAINEGGSVPHSDVAKLLYYIADMGE